MRQIGHFNASGHAGFRHQTRVDTELLDIALAIGHQAVEARGNKIGGLAELECIGAHLLGQRRLLRLVESTRDADVAHLGLQVDAWLCHLAHPLHRDVARGISTSAVRGHHHPATRHLGGGFGQPLLRPRELLCALGLQRDRIVCALDLTAQLALAAGQLVGAQPGRFQLLARSLHPCALRLMGAR